jgi:DNA-binding GntR family transcriptional regulator
MEASTVARSKTKAFEGNPEPTIAAMELSNSFEKGSRVPRAYQLLRDAISRGELKPGSRILEKELAVQYDMSRTPVREAIAALEAEGLIMVDGSRGRVVTQLDYQSIMELYAVREALESTAAGLAARNASDMEIVVLKNLLATEDMLLDNAELLAEHNRRFHDAICLCSHNRYIVKMLHFISASMLVLGPATRAGSDRRNTALVEHTDIVNAIAERDAHAAEAATRKHIRQAQQARVAMLFNRQHETK